MFWLFFTHNLMNHSGNQLWTVVYLCNHSLCNNPYTIILSQMFWTQLCTESGLWCNACKLTFLDIICTLLCNNLSFHIYKHVCLIYRYAFAYLESAFKYLTPNWRCRISLFFIIDMPLTSQVLKLSAPSSWSTCFVMISTTKYSVFTILF